MKKTGGKSFIVKAVMAQGFTARKAQEAVNAVVERMKFALWCGEPVAIPGGTIQAKIRQGKPRREWQEFRNIRTQKIEHRFVHYPGRRRTVKFTPDLALDLTPPPLPPVPPVPETPEQVEVRQLASALLGKPADQAILATLQRAVEVHPHKPGALLRRLREIRVRRWPFGDVHSLAGEVSAHYWL